MSEVGKQGTKNFPAKGGEESMTVTVEGHPKEIAALALELQERRGKSVDIPESDAHNLVIKNDQARNAQDVIREIRHSNVR